MYIVTTFIGSLRKRSWTRKIAVALPALAPSALRLEIAEIGDIPLYNEDLETDVPQAWQRLRATVAASDAILFVTPEYNRSVPAVLKNAVDVGSRPLPRNVWRDKPAAIISVSPGAMGGFGANHHLRQILVGVGARALARPEAYIGNVPALLAADGSIGPPTTRQFLSDFLAAFAEMIAIIKEPSPR